MRAAAVMLAASLCLCGCPRRPDVAVGGLYSVADEEGAYKVAKVLALDEDGVHIRLYKNKWPRRPKDVAPDTLTLGSVYDPDGYGIGHLAMTKEEFYRKDPVFLGHEDLKPDERDGYEAWKRWKKRKFGANPMVPASGL